ncbi:hypothetical protein B0H66DRAFT_537340 [Apodospora peruviana]|uniref:Uncharacterized protein n=1 Tax=Apodospora peruviana TaxID=516989 RepID=A0AAE0M018_9PEZI|nr:hypothetical protein B0H66DRAFT_537340 [Apodospora peruviana]
MSGVQPHNSGSSHLHQPVPDDVASPSAVDRDQIAMERNPKYSVHGASRDKKGFHLHGSRRRGEAVIHCEFGDLKLVGWDSWGLNQKRCKLMTSSSWRSVLAQPPPEASLLPALLKLAEQQPMGSCCRATARLDACSGSDETAKLQRLGHWVLRGSDDFYNLQQFRLLFDSRKNRAVRPVGFVGISASSWLLVLELFPVPPKSTKQKTCCRAMSSPRAWTGFSLSSWCFAKRAKQSWYLRSTWLYCSKPCCTVHDHMETWKTANDGSSSQCDSNPASKTEGLAGRRSCTLIVPAKPVHCKRSAQIILVHSRHFERERDVVSQAFGISALLLVVSVPSVVRLPTVRAAPVTKLGRRIRGHQPVI